MTTTEQPTPYEADYPPVKVKARLPQGVRLDVRVRVERAQPAAVPHPRPERSEAAWKAWVRANAGGVLLAAALAVYLLVRFIGLDAFPIYFFTDEAVQTVRAAELVRDDFSSGDEYLPTYFNNGGQYNLGVSVYLQVIPYLLFGKSVWVTRGVSVLVGLIAALAAAGMLRRSFGVQHAWAGVLLLSLTPAWFLHSRTAFETVEATAFYAAFLYFYLRYRGGQPRALYAAALMAALAFYTYSPAQVVVAVSVALLAVSDARYHWQQRGVVLRALGLGLILLLPYARFYFNHPDENYRHLEILRSYWLQDIPAVEKLRLYFSEYLKGLNPLYWFAPNNQDLARHLMKGYAHLWQPSLPFFILGLGMALRRIRRPEYRALLIALLAAPTGAALVGIGITRTLFMVIPAAVLTALGLTAVLDRAQRRWKAGWLPALVWLLLAAANLGMLTDALRNGPLWYRDYGLEGMQYGAPQIFQQIDEYLAENPGTQLMLSPSWANGTHVLMQFFSADPAPYELGSIVGYFNEHRPLDEQMVFVMIPEELEDVRASGKFTNLHIDQVLDYPDGRPGFYFVRLRYVDEIDAILAEEKAARQVLQSSLVTILGSEARVEYSALDMGRIEDLFDGDPGSITRGMEANPLRVEIYFDRPKTISSLTLRVGGVATRVIARLYDAEGHDPLTLDKTVNENPLPRDVGLSLDQPMEVLRVEIEVLSVNDGEPAHVHLWEIAFK